ncbi:MAG: beta-N-acetylhexosaminidase [Thermodesulfobacteriota bacterium]
MDVRELGGLFMVGFEGTRFDSELSDFLAELRPAGVILFARNVEDPRQVGLLNKSVQSHCLGTHGEGILIGVDQEGGRVRRLREPFTVFPAALELAASADPEQAVRGFARVTATELRLTGFNLDFAPVLDVVRDTVDVGNSVIGDRSFGANPDLVARLGLIVMETFADQGVISCCKHFPGHGGTSVDSHVDLPVDDRDAGSIETTDLLPFARAVRNHAPMLMTAHVRFPGLDPESCATFSPLIVRGLLREKLGYDGVVVTDDLDMGAVTNYFSPEEACLRAILAGSDMLLICNRPEKVLDCRTRLMEALRDGDLTEGRVRQALARIRRLKDRFRTSMIPCKDQPLLRHLGLIG